MEDAMSNVMVCLHAAACMHAEGGLCTTCVHYTYDSALVFQLSLLRARRASMFAYMHHSWIPICARVAIVIICIACVVAVFTRF